uniref:Ig-like domain-containing protein n=1 Tax=Esox lucius TaxID=8010 RepID=A0AAY5L8Y1_ESOLU
MRMNIFVIILILSGTVCTSAQDHELFATLTCFEPSHPELVVMVDGDEVGYTDFQKDEPVMLLPTPADIHIPFSIVNAYAQLSEMWCKERIAWGELATPSIPQVKALFVTATQTACIPKGLAPHSLPQGTKDAPESTIYTRNEVELGVNNTLICFFYNFFPPAIKVNWTKNGMEVTGGASLSRYHPNKDGTFHLFSTLSFTPLEGDIYACTVEHTALEEPKTRSWEPEVSEFSAGPTIFCGVCLTLGLLGVATGTFLLTKRKPCFKYFYTQTGRTGISFDLQGVSANL